VSFRRAQQALAIRSCVRIAGGDEALVSSAKIQVNANTALASLNPSRSKPF
jgi:hypothetical protein